MDIINIKEAEEKSLLLVHGRHSYLTEPEKINNALDKDCVALFYTGAGIEVNVKASELYVNMYSDYDMYENWISVIINGAMIQRIMLGKGMNRICCFRLMNSEEAKNVRIMMENQTFESDRNGLLIVTGLETDGELLKTEEKKLKIEFLGDSITSSEGAIGAKNDLDWIPMYFSAHNSYPYFTSKLLDADYRVVAQSGWGMVCSWDGNPLCSVPMYYEKVCGLARGEKQAAAGSTNLNDFNSWKPDVVLINLGTNDFSGFKNPSPEITDELLKAEKLKDYKNGNLKAPYRFEGDRLIYDLKMKSDGSFDDDCEAYWVSEAVKNLKKIRSLNPDANILWALGMLGSGLFPLVKKAISVYQAETGDARIDFVPLKECNDDTVGSRNHPGPKNHMEAAISIAERIRKIENL
ncbi:MAG: GDSL family lipase [Lachnospiraceae bacterium]|nr:GDSL family lipase [Lachnospiraceae bacterium]